MEAYMAGISNEN
ncbi:hypothetical protein BLA29_015559 [Euroglyphus maynei]|uniref:Uncharacterized protein n=1 Tax=Euroglyphus maynei TaxID=6958 RepID=A0A1Y3AQE2_EURMA|nr:hypothetical protein BLA29_015559 [Euroglyphus maynei]